MDEKQSCPYTYRQLSWSVDWHIREESLLAALACLDNSVLSAPLDSLLFEQVNKKLIVEQWDEMQRVASSIRHGTVLASLLMRKLAAYPRQNQVARALTEFGKLERTSLLEYFRDAALRRMRVWKALTPVISHTFWNVLFPLLSLQ